MKRTTRCLSRRALACGLACLATSPVAAQEMRDMTVDDMLHMVGVEEVAITPDGAQVFYTERRLNWETNKYERTLFTVSSQGGDVPKAGR